MKSLLWMLDPHTKVTILSDMNANQRVGETSPACRKSNERMKIEDHQRIDPVETAEKLLSILRRPPPLPRGRLSLCRPHIFRVCILHMLA